MYKTKLVNLLKQHGDATLIFKDRNTEDIVATTDFRNKYIRSKGSMKIPAKGVLVWDWTNNSRRVIKPEDVVRVIPLSKTLNNVRDY